MTASGSDYCRLSAFKTLVISTYNVRTLFQTGKLHQLFTGCADAGIDMIGIQEHRLFTTNPTEELWSEDRNWVFIYGSAANRRVGGVGFVISKPIYRCIQKVEVISERILHATFHGNPRLSVTVVYAPTECGQSTAKDNFYASLAEHLEQLKRRDINLVVGDFNARIGTDSHHTHHEVVGRYCYHDQTNDNGERLVNLCVEHNLRPAQSRFPHPLGRLWTWNHPAGSKHQLDHILINSKWVNSLRNCRAYNSVELDSDHRIVSIHLLTRLRSNKKTTCKRPKFNWKKLQNPTTKNKFQLELSSRFEALTLDDQSIDLSKRYESLESTVRDVAEEVLGKQGTHGLPSWVSKETTKIKIQRDEAKKRFQLTKSPQARVR